MFMLLNWPANSVLCVRAVPSKSLKIMVEKVPAGHKDIKACRKGNSRS